MTNQSLVKVKLYFTSKFVSFKTLKKNLLKYVNCMIMSDVYKAGHSSYVIQCKAKNPHIHDRSFSCLGTGTLINSGGVKLTLWAKISRLCEMMCTL